MISFELPEKTKMQLQMVEMVAKQVMRPHSRYYDEHEHERPQEFIEMIWPVMKQQNKAQLDKLKDNGSATKKEGLNTGILNLILAIEMLSYGDTGQYLCIPSGGLGGAAVEAVGTTEQKSRFMSRFAEGDEPAW